MGDHHELLTSLALVLCVAAVTTLLFQRLRQPVVLGYLLAGAIVGPHTPIPLFADAATVHTLSELGVILLMFALGLELSLGKLFRIGATAGTVALIQSSLMIWIGYMVCQAFGWTWIESLYAGAIIAISSTTIIVKAFAEQGMRGRVVDLVFGVLIFEDLIAVVLLTIFPQLGNGGEISGGGLLETTSMLATFLVVVAIGGLLLVPRLMRAVSRLDRPETTLVVSMGLCFGLALLAQKLGYSVALGAFLAGALVAESGEGKPIERLIEPVRDMFAAVFFVAIGMLIQPSLIVEYWQAILAFTAVVIVGKIVAVTVATFLVGESVRTSMQVGMSLAQIGEFSFIIAGVGTSSAAVGEFLYPLAVSVSAITTLSTPWLIRASTPLALSLERHLPHRLQTYAALYGTWLQRLGSGGAKRSPVLRRLSRLLLTDAVLLTLVIVISAISIDPLVARMVDAFGFSELLSWSIMVGFSLALALPLCIGLARVSTALAGALAKMALPSDEARVDVADAPRRALAATIQLALVLVVGLPILALTQPFLSFDPAGAVLAILGFLLLIGIWRSIGNLQEHAEAGAQVIVELLARQTEGGREGLASEDVEQMHRMLPGLGEPEPIRLMVGSRAVGKTLADLNLRGLTGATVLAIVRAGSGVLVPTGREVLRADDLLAIAGTRDSIEAAREILS